MIYPDFLKAGDKVGVPAPSDGANCPEKVARLKNAKKKFEDLGFEVEFSKNIFNSEKSRSADARTRGEELNEMFSRSDIDYIICAAGGEFLVECLPFVDFELLAKNPKFVQGFSDPTGLLFPITTKYDIATFYGMNFGEYGMEDWQKNLFDSLEIMKGNLLAQNSSEKYASTHAEYITGLESYPLDSETVWKTLDEKPAKFSGRLIGGCMDILAELAGTKYDGMNEFNEKYKEDGVVLYFDNCELSFEETIRVLWKFNELGYFKYASGVIFGRFGCEFPSDDYEDVRACLKDSVLNNLNIPVVFDADVSHKAPSLLLMNGALAEIEVTAGKGSIKQL